MSSGTGVTCNRCQQSGLGWCVSRATKKHYLAWLVLTPTVAADGVTVTQTMRPQPNLLHKCGQTIDQARESAAQYAAERARTRALGTAPQPIAAPAPAASKPAKPARAAKAPAAAKVASTAAVGAVSAVDKIGVPIPFNAGQHIPSADIPGPVESAVIMTNALVAKGYPREIAAAIVAAGKPDQIAALLLK